MLRDHKALCLDLFVLVGLRGSNAFYLSISQNTLGLRGGRGGAEEQQTVTTK